ncbi:hypothetical protein ACR9E3_32380 [Actinomycetospora sp. C-140]
MTASTATADTADTATGAAPSRGPWIASVALAVAIVVAAGLAVVTLVREPAGSVAAPSTTQDEPVAAPLPQAPPLQGTGNPAPPQVPAGQPAVTDTTGRALPAAVATGVGGLYTALGTGDLPGVQSRYRPAAAFDAAPWSQVAPLLTTAPNREQLLAALREPPQRRSGIYRYAANGAVVGVDAQGRMAFMLLP